MKKPLAVFSILLFVSVSVIPSTGTTIGQSSRTLLYDGNILFVGGNGTGNYSKIQDAIDDTNDGDSVFVYDDSSPYYENVVLDKSISLIGEDKDTTVIDGFQGINAIEIISNNVNVRGFTIQHSYEGIFIKDCMNNIIENNIFTYNKRSGIKLDNSSHNKIIGNIVFNNGERGILLTDCIENDIKGNIISYHIIGISLFHSHNNNFSENTISDNDIHGYSSFKSDNVTLIGNTFINHSENAVMMSYPSNNTISKNTIINSTKMGISLWNSHNKNRIFRNTLIHNNRSGIHLWNCSNHEIFWNDIRENYFGIHLVVANNNNISSNNVIQNNIDAFFTHCFKNSWRSNYWSRPRLLPYPIFGKIMGILYWVNFDWHPAQEPYDIGV